MDFNKLYNRVVHNEAKEKQKREENVEQYDHSASVAEQEEEYDDGIEYDDDFRHAKHTWDGADVALKLPGRSGEYVVEGTVTYTIEEERPDASNGYIGSRWHEVEDVEVTGVFLVGNDDEDAEDITEDVTFEEMDLAEKALVKAFDYHSTD